MIFLIKFVYIFGYGQNVDGLKSLMILYFFITENKMFEWIKSKGSKNRRDYGSFKFSLKSQPDVIDSSSTISLIAHTNGFGNATIPCIYRWSIIKNGVKI